MKIAVFHNRYQTRGGEDSMFELEVSALRAAGQEVVTYEVDNTQALGSGDLKAKIRTALDAPHSQSSKVAIEAFLEKERPDISHVHNWFPLLSPSIYTAHKKVGIPVVQTLHNYRLGCADATYRRDGKDCTLCTRSNNRAAIKHRCYNDSLLGSITWKRMIDRNWKNGNFTENVDHYLCPSNEVYQRHLSLGIPEAKLSILPNACPDPQELTQLARSKNTLQVCFVARLVQEKGPHTLIEAWLKLSVPTRNKSQLTIIGDGPEMAALKALAGDDKSILFYGALDHSRTLQELNRSHLLVCPTLWAEPFGLSVIEAMGAGIPVIASKLGGPAEIIEHGITGYHVPAGDPTALHQAIDELLTSPVKALNMGSAARTCYEMNYTTAAHADKLLNCFTEVISAYEPNA